MKLKEIYWLIGSIGLVLILILVIFGINMFDTDATLNINIHDTYFIISNFHITLFIFVLTLFFIYLFRTIRLKFKNITVNLVLITITIFSVIVLEKAIETLSIFSAPTNSDEISDNKNPVQQILNITSRILFIIQIGLLFLISYCGYKTGQNYNTKGINPSE